MVLLERTAGNKYYLKIRIPEEVWKQKVGYRAFVSKEKYEKEVRKILRGHISNFLRRFREGSVGLSKEALQRFSSDLIREYTEELKNLLFTQIASKYIRTRESVIKKRGVPYFNFTAADSDALAVLQTTPILSKVYSNLDEFLTEKINQAITDAFVEGAIKFTELNKNIREITGFAYYRADRIARTETAAVINYASATTFSQVDKQLEIEGRYRMIGASDRRTCSICATAHSDTERGMIMGNLGKYINEHQKGAKRPFGPLHPSCRCSISPVL